MRNLHLLFALLLSVMAYSQPKIIGSLSRDGKKSGGSIFRSNLPGIAPDTIHIFDNLAPHAASSGLANGEDDFLYGMLQVNGSDNNGGLYKIKKDGTGLNVVSRLTNVAGAGTTPFYHSDGMVYFNNEFELRKYDPGSGTVTSLPLSSGTVQKNLWIDSSDWIYLNSEINQLVKLKTDGSSWTVLHSFDMATEGEQGLTGVTEIPGDTLFGQNTYGGQYGGGTIYSIKKDGTGFTVHHQFDAATGFTPESRLVYFDGKLYGMTLGGGDFSNGVIYRINSDGSNYQVLHHFVNTIGGGQPANNISISGDGTIFGSFRFFASDGTAFYRMFKVDTSGQNYRLFYFVVQRDQGDLNRDPLLLSDSIFLATANMGRHDGGVLTLIDTGSAAAPQELIHFGQSLNGFQPNALIKGSDDALYGSTVIGGSSGNGILFRMNSDGTGYTKLHEFTDAEGYKPEGKLLEASDGKLYGVCSSGGPDFSGCLFRIDRSGANFTVLNTFPGSFTAKSPNGGLVEDNNGVLYGTHRFGTSFLGAIFSVHKDGSNYTVLKDFSGSDLSRPMGSLIWSAGYLYGTCLDGGTSSTGGVFRIRTDGSGYQVLHDFNVTTDGVQTQAGLLLASNGKLYGTTSANSVLFRIDTTGFNYTILHTFDAVTEGGVQSTALIQASDGMIYGATGYSGFGGGGVLFKMATDGSGFSIVRSFQTDVNGQSAAGILDLQPPVVLPVRLLDFTATQKENGVDLRWTTATELNSDHFEIERSSSAGPFVAIGRVNSVGGNGASAHYVFTDRLPLQGFNYYRLKQVDRDGRFDYSKVVAVKIDQPFFTLAPNPAHNYLDLRFTPGYSLLRLTDAAGRMVLQQDLSSSANRITLDLSQLPAGWYSVELVGKEKQRQVFLKH